MPTASTASCAARGDDGDATRRWRTSGASRPGCGATPTCSTSSAGCATHNDGAAGRARQGRASTGSTSTACTPRSRPCSRYLDKVDPEAARGPAHRYALLRALRRGPAGVRLRRRVRARAESCEDEVVEQLVELQRRARRARCAATAASPRTSSSSPSRTRGVGAERRGVLPLDVPRPGVVLEPARPAHGRDARRAGRRTSTGRRRGRRRSSSGRTTRTSATRAPPRWAQGGELNLGQLVRERYGRDASLRRLHHLRRHGDRGLRLGRAGASASGCGPALPGSYEALFHEVGAAALPARAARACAGAHRGRAARAAPGAGDRRHLPAARPSASATTSTRACPSSSTPCSTSTRRARSSRWSVAPPGGTPPSRPRPTPRRCSPQIGAGRVGSAEKAPLACRLRGGPFVVPA